MAAQLVIGIVGIHGAYGRWLAQFFRQRMGLQVIGRDPALADNPSERELIERADVLLFSAPIRHTVALIRQYASQADGREAGHLWLDVTSLKSGPMQAMLESQAEVVGLHPMTAPPKAPTLKGRPTVVCEGRLQHWRPWFEHFLQALQGEYVRADPEQHDRVMARVQAMVHASHLAQAGVLREGMPTLGPLQELMPLRSASFEMDVAIAARILALNPAIYEDIQFDNPHVPAMLDQLLRQLQRLRDLIGQGDDAARASFRREFLQSNLAAFGEDLLQRSNYRFEQLGYLLADLTEVQSLSVHLPEDAPGSLRRLLQVFEDLDISLTSLHSSRTPQGEVHFRIGFAPDCRGEQLALAAERIVDDGIGRIVTLA
ncbi:prephenate dehydrogenase [Pseudoxanthomonas dokdonensis]|uniref:Prephenate dehydrogenase n=1 Tax=Pseudoxanthomonas dokdonensis TaxID=344882 RepID=A0A0R0CYF0_9GAMM|nr:prephenate dehydrogenase [Pseudoxanthomonas dokdonensis]KRG71175.1 prephenate dehydrogenase [Pseudoxanthomonas dokdonensis]